MSGWDPEAVMSRLGLAVAALVSLWAALRGLCRLLARVQHFLDDWFGEEARDGIPARPGVMERLESLERAVQEGNDAP